MPGLNRSAWTGGVRLFGWKKTDHVKHMNPANIDHTEHGYFSKVTKVHKKHFI